MGDCFFDRIQRFYLCPQLLSPCTRQQRRHPNEGRPALRSATYNREPDYVRRAAGECSTSVPELLHRTAGKPLQAGVPRLRLLLELLRLLLNQCESTAKDSKYSLSS